MPPSQTASPNTRAHLRTSPKTSPPDPRMNPFSPLSPHLLNTPLQDPRMETGQPETIQAMMDRRHGQKFSFYAPARLLGIAKRLGYRAHQQPQSMLPLDSWYGAPPTAKATATQHFDDPAIASVSAATTHSGRRGIPSGYNEGFGMGGNIVQGRGGNRGVRAPGLRRPDGASELTTSTTERRDGQSQVGRFNHRDAVEKGGSKPPPDEMRQAFPGPRVKRDEPDWRRADTSYIPGGNPRRGPGGSGWNDRHNRHEDEGVEPAWMQDDSATGFDDPAIATFAADDSLVKFKPGEDLIAAGRHPHADAAAGSTWRRPLEPPAFFAAPGHQAPPQTSGPSRPRTFNTADFLKPSKPDSDEEPEAMVDPQPLSDDQEQSRFHRFFTVPTVQSTEPAAANPGGGPDIDRPFFGYQGHPSPRDAEKDGTTRFMDLLALNANGPPRAQPPPMRPFFDQQTPTMPPHLRPPGFDQLSSTPTPHPWDQGRGGRQDDLGRQEDPRHRNMGPYHARPDQRPPPAPSQSELLLQSLQSGMPRPSERRPTEPLQSPDAAQLLAETQRNGARFSEPAKLPLRTPTEYHYLPPDQQRFAPERGPSPHDLLQKLRFGDGSAVNAAYQNQVRPPMPPPGPGAQYPPGFAAPRETHRQAETMFYPQHHRPGGFPPANTGQYGIPPPGSRPPEQLQRELLNSLLGPR